MVLPPVLPRDLAKQGNAPRPRRSRDNEQNLAAQTPLGPAHFAIAVAAVPMPHAVLIATWPELPGRGVDIFLTLGDIDELVGALLEARVKVAEMLDEL